MGCRRESNPITRTTTSPTYTAVVPAHQIINHSLNLNPLPDKYMKGDLIFNYSINAFVSLRALSAAKSERIFKLFGKPPLLSPETIVGI